MSGVVLSCEAYLRDTACLETCVNCEHLFSPTPMLLALVVCDEIVSDGYVFGDEIGRQRHPVKTAWLSTRRRSNVTDLHFHDLRREAGSRWMDAGVSLGDIQRWLGHANISQTSTYVGASIGNDEAAMKAYEARIGRISAFNGESVKSPTVEITQPSKVSDANPSGRVHGSLTFMWSTDAQDVHRRHCRS